MPHKSQRRRGKHSAQSKKRKSRLDSSVTVAQQQTTAQTYRPVSRPSVSAPSASVPAHIATPTATQYPYIVAELRRIGILAGIVLAILIVLASVLH